MNISSLINRCRYAKHCFDDAGTELKVTQLEKRESNETPITPLLAALALPNAVNAEIIEVPKSELIDSWTHRVFGSDD